METSQRQPQHTGRVLAWWCSSFGTSDSRVHLCQCSPALHPAGLGSWGTPCSVPQCMAEQGTRAGHQPSQICFSGRTCGMLPGARPMFAAGGFVAHSTAMFLSEVPLMNQLQAGFGSEAAEWSFIHVLYRAKRVCCFLQKHLLAELFTSLILERDVLSVSIVSGRYELHQVRCVQFSSAN